MASATTYKREWFYRLDDNSIVQLSFPIVLEQSEKGKIEFTRCVVLIRDDRDSRREFRRECKRQAIEYSHDGTPTEIIGSFGRGPKTLCLIAFPCIGGTENIESAFYEFGKFKPFVHDIEFRQLTVPYMGTGQGIPKS